MYSIGIIAAERSLHNILQVDEEMRKHCNLTYLPYTSLEHLFYLFQENAARFDGLLFSGSYPYFVIKEHFGEIPVPSSFFAITDRDYYGLIAQLVLQNRELDFSRVYFDRPEIPVDFSFIFPHGQEPVLGEYIPVDIPYSKAYLPSLAYYQKLWNSGRVDLIVTRFSSMKEELDRSGIQHRILFPSPSSMLETFQGLMMLLSSQDTHDSATCIGLVSLGEGSSQEQQDELMEQIERCNQSLGGLFLIYRHGDHIELTTNISVLKGLTRRYTVCPVAAFLKNELSFPVYIGWGCSANVIQAHQNAQYGMKEAKQSKQTASYVVTAEKQVIGPLSVSYKKDGEVLLQGKLTHLSKISGVSVQRLQQIYSIAGQQGMETISAAELADTLQVTVRSASRILKKLEDCGLVRVKYDRKQSQRGRPIKEYCFQPVFRPHNPSNS